MKKILIFLALLSRVLPVLAASSLPQDVKKFVERREGCDHMRGEIPGPRDQQRIRDLNREIEKLCKGTDRDLLKLKKKYASKATVMQRLNEFEEGIEAPETPAAGHGAGGRP